MDPDPDLPADASRTALGVAGQRAAHLWLDDPPPILDDPVAARLLGPGGEAFVRGRAARFGLPGSKALRASVVVRSRFAEDELEVAAARGVRRAVILGAGFDTFGYPQPAWARDLQIAELDHAASQAAKLDRLRSAGIGVPANVRHAPIDLVSGDLAGALASAGIDLAAPTFVAWLGVMVYLPPEASDRVLGSVAALPPGSELVLTFAHPPIPGRDHLGDAVAATGEPWLDRPGPDAMAGRLEAAGFARWSVVPTETIRERYFAGRSDLPAPRRASLAIALT
jgi:methyltransferase (TIGR00027 family)